MSVYSLKKWFFDVLLHQDSYLYFYVTEIKFLGLKLSRFNLNYSSDDFGTSVSESIKLKSNNIYSFLCSSGAFHQNLNNFLINQKLKETNIELVYKNNELINSQINAYSAKTKNSAIDWLPILMKSQVSGTIKLNSKYIPVTNMNGYIDYFQTNVSPYRNQMRDLFWGRLHTSELDLSYSIVYNKHDEKFYSSCICRNENKVLRTNKSNLTIIQKDWSKNLNLTYPKKLSIEFHFNTFEIILYIEQSKILIESKLTEEQRSMKKFIINVLKWIVKNPRGLKFLSKGEVEIRHNKSIKIMGTHLITEYVRFGKN
jgi:hypothetical protein